MASRAGILARLRRLERTNSSRSAMERELADLEHRHLSHTSESIHAMSDAELDDLLRVHSMECGPLQRIDELRRKLGVANWAVEYTQAELDAAFAKDAP